MGLASIGNFAARHASTAALGLPALVLNESASATTSSLQNTGIARMLAYPPIRRAGESGA
jgi:hypothetical protein